MDHSIHPTALRLVGETPGDIASRTDIAGRTDVENENRAAASLGAGDAMQLFAMRVSESLDGGRSAILTPSKRRGLLNHGHRLGVRDFDANLVIAIVQDGARRGENIHNKLTGERLGFLFGSATLRKSESMVRMVVVAVAIAIGALIGLIAWITGG